MISGLKYFDGAIPGKKRKSDSSDGGNRNKKYEANRIERTLNEKWKIGRDWLRFEEGKMFCDLCTDQYHPGTSSCLRGQNTFVTGCTNKRVSAVQDHEKSGMHIKAAQISSAKTATGTQILRATEAGRALISLKQSERHRLTHLVRNAHAIIKHNRPLSDFRWICELDKLKGLDIGNTYQNDRAALDFVSSIAKSERESIACMLNKAAFISFMMDGSTDLSGDEQEAIYIRTSVQGKIFEKFLGIGTPKSTCSKDLEDFVIDMLESYGIQKEKIIGMGSDGASNMTGIRNGLAALLRKDINSELVNIHCFAHRLELAFRDVLKKFRLYDKLMTLLIGLHYFYKKQYKNKHGLLEAINGLNIRGILPPKVTGTRWLPHLSRGLLALTRTFRAFEAHLSSLSHTNPKAEGLVKIMILKELVCFVLFLQELLDPLMRLSLKLQKPESTVAEGRIWVEATIELLEELKISMDTGENELSEVLTSGSYQGISLIGKTPSMSYKESVIDDIIAALRARFSLNDSEINVVRATSILHFKNWPASDSPESQEFAEAEIRIVSDHFKETLSRAKPDFDAEDVLKEWKLLKKVLYKRHGSQLPLLKWADAYDTDFASVMLIIDLLNCIPPTSVTCETTFSQMKLIKTARRTRMRNNTLNDLLTVKLESPDVEKFDPTASIDTWLASSLKPRLLNYKRDTTKKGTEAAARISIDLTMTEDIREGKDTETEAENVDEDNHDEGDGEDIITDDLVEEEINLLNKLCDKDDDDDEFCDDFSSEAVLCNIMMFAKE